jgi:hypothetical protein
MTTASEFSPQNLDSDDQNTNQESAISDGRALVALWLRWKADDHEVCFGRLGNRDLIFDRLFDIMHQKHDLSPMFECFPRTIIPDLFWTGRAVAKVAPEVEFFLDLADMLVSCDDGTGECDFRQTKQMLA